MRLLNDPPVYCIIHDTQLEECYLEGVKDSKCEWVFGEPIMIEEDNE